MDIRYTHSVPSELLYQPHSLYRNNNNNNNIQYPLPLRPSWSTNTTKTRNTYNNNSNNNDLILPINKILPQQHPIHNTSKKNNRYKQVKNKSSTSFPYVQGISFPDNSQHLYSSNTNHYSNFDKIAHHKQKNMEQRSHTATTALINEEYRIPQNKNKPILKTISSNNYQYEKNITGKIANNMNTIQYTKNNNSGPSKYDNTNKMKGKKPLSINTQSYNKPRSIPVTTNNNAVILENKSIQPVDQIRVQRKPIPILQQKSKKSTSVPNLIMDYNSFNSSLQQNSNNNNNNIDLSQNSRSPSKKSQWKVSGQHDGLLLRSPLSSTPPSLLYESSSTTTSTTQSSSLESQHYQLNNNNNNNNNNSTSNISKKSSYEYIKPTTPTSSLSSSHGYNSKHTNKKIAASKGHKKSSSLSSSSIGSLSTRSRYSFNNDYESQTSSSTERLPRRYSQGDCHPSTPLSHTETNYPYIQQRASTPKLRRVHSAKPCIKRINEIQPNSNNNNNNSFSSTNDVIDNANNNSDDHYNKNNNKSDKKNPTLSSSFWNPRTEKDILPVKRTLSKRIRGLLLPQRSKLDEACKDRHVVEYQWSVARPMTPTDEISFFNDAFLEDPENGIMDNPFYMISQSWNIVDQPGLHFNEHDFTQMDIYAASVQQRGPSLTPKILTQKFLVRPYRRDLYRLRIIFTWILQNISIIDQRVHEDHFHYHQNNSTDQNNLSTETITNSKSNSNNNNRSGGKKLSLRRRLSHRHSTSSLQDNTEELDMPSIDVLHGDGLLPEGGGDVESFDDWLLSESAHQVLLNRTCTSSIGMANLFCDMAIAAGFQDAKVVYGYLRAPKDSIKSATMDSQDDQYDDDSLTLIQNHAWCCVKVEGEYRFVDCWLASPSQPQNHNKIESHWFLTKPKDMIFTHYPQEYEDQFLEPRINLSTFFALPYVWSSFFLHHIQFIRYDPFAISMVDDQVCHLSFRVDFNVICYAYVEVDSHQNNNDNNSNGNSNINNGMIRALAQCRTITLENGESERIYKIKAVLPAGYSHGWLKIYTNNTKSSTTSMPVSSSTSTTTTAAATTITTSSIPPSSATSSSLPSSSLTLSPLMETPRLALCFQLTHHQHYHSTSSSDNMKSSFEFVQLHPCKYEFYVQEPQCYHLYPLQTYNFLIRGGDTHHKLAIRSPNGKLYKLMSYPQEHSYDGSITISEIGKWSLIYLLHHAGGWSSIATWECKGQ